jgi:hypothetical protein
MRVARTWLRQRVLCACDEERSYPEDGGLENDSINFPSFRIAQSTTAEHSARKAGALAGFKSGATTTPCRHSPALAPPIGN